MEGVFHSASFDRYVDALIAGGKSIVKLTEVIIGLRELPNYTKNTEDVLIEHINVTFMIISD